MVAASHFSSKIYNKILLHYALQSSTFISKHSTWGNRLHNLIRKFSFPRIYFMTLSFSSKIFLFWFHPLPMLCQTISMPSEVNAFLKNPNQSGSTFTNWDNNGYTDWWTDPRMHCCVCGLHKCCQMP